MNFTLIVCTYQRADAIKVLIESVNKQEVYPNQILIIDSSLNNDTKEYFESNIIKNLEYFLVDIENRGLTKQRNYGISKVDKNSEIICFVDDDTELFTDYFKQIMFFFKNNKKAIGVGGIAVNENKWRIKPKKYIKKYSEIDLENYYLVESKRNVIRKFFKLNSPKLSGIMPPFSHGKSNSYPLNDKAYKVDLIIGMSMSFRKELFDKIKFSEYFEGYSLYEDADFSINALNYGDNYINTKVKLNHFHDSSGRPNNFLYGKMVLRNGWYVWRKKYPKPNLINRIKWNLISLLLILIRLTNISNPKNFISSITEVFGRIYGWFSLVFNKPKLEI